jgi:hypothetical protein
MEVHANSSTAKNMQQENMVRVPGTLLNFWVTANILYRYRVNVWHGKTFSTLGQV